MKQINTFLQKYWSNVLLILLGLAALAALLFYRLDTLVSGLSPAELQVATTPIGWLGIYNDPLYLPLQIIRSVVFTLSADHSAVVTRLPNLLFGATAVICFASIVRFWHGNRTTLFATIMFATAAWTLHVARYASFDAVYLSALPVLLLSKIVLRRYAKHLGAVCAVLFTWGILLFTPGLLWLILLTVYWLRRDLRQVWRLHTGALKRTLILIAGLGWLPILGAHFVLEPKAGLLWLGLPERLNPASELLHQLVAVPYHLFVHAPAIPELWLLSTPLLDLFTLVMTVLGVIYYIRNWRASRSRILLSYLVVGTLLIGLGGSVPLSLVVPLVYLLAAAGVGSLIGEWLKTFPLNPVVRGLGIGLVAVAVSISVSYNLRSYFIAWQHNNITEGTIFTDTP